jgi:two-component system LytT family response regulator
MTPIRTLLVDDEPPARRRLRRLLADFPAFHIVGEAGQVADAERRVQEARPDLIFLDIEMPGGNGFTLLDGLPTALRPCIVLLTAHQQFALQAYENAVFDYLLKPVGPARFAAVMQRLQDHFRPQIGQGTPDSRYRSHVLVPLPDTSLAIGVAQIDLFEAERNYVRIHVAGTSYLLRAGLTDLLKSLDPSLFRQANRSAIIRIAAIVATRQAGHGDVRVTLLHGQQLIWSRRFRAQMPQSLR